MNTHVYRSVRDGLRSLVTRLGTSDDKAYTASYNLELLDDTELESAFRTSWVAKKLVNLVPLDATRRWRQWQGNSPEAIREIELLPRLNVQRKIYEAYWRGRLWGGAGVLIGTRNANWELPLDPNTEEVEYLTVLTRQELSVGEIEVDAREERYGKAKYYTIHTNAPNANALFEVHPSRVIEFFGEDLPRVAQMANGWGESVLQSVYESCRNMDSTMSNIASLVFEAKTDVIKIPGLSNNITNQEFETALLTRFGTARMLKGNHGMLILDSEEEYDSKSYSFGGLDTIADRFMQIVSGAADVPIIRFFGTSVSGLSNNGEGNLKNYYDRVEGIQQTQLGPVMSPLDQMIVQQAGQDWNGYNFKWLSLHQMSPQNEVEILEKSSRAISDVAGTGNFTRESITQFANQTLEKLGYDPLETGEEVQPVPGNLEDARPRSLYICRKVLNGSEILSWAKEQGFENTLSAEDLHVTLVYSTKPVDWMKVGESNEPQIEIGAGGPRQMEQFGAAKVLLFASDSLVWRQRYITEYVGASFDYDEYQPHITITYDGDGPNIEDIQPYEGRIVLGPEIFREIDKNWSKNLDT